MLLSIMIKEQQYTVKEIKIIFYDALRKKDYEKIREIQNAVSIMAQKRDANGKYFEGYNNLLVLCRIAFHFEKLANRPKLFG